jgi:two-component system CheB/CheR fusion protein
LGSSEHIGPALSSMLEIDKKWKVYKNVTKAKVSDSDSVFSILERGPAISGHTKVKNPLFHIPELFKETLLEEYKFAGIYIDTNFEVKQATGNYKNYIDLPDTGFNFNIMKLVSPDLGIALNIAIRKAMKDNETVTMKRVKVKKGSEIKTLNITVKPYLKQKEYQQQFLFIILNDNQRREFSENGHGLEMSKVDRIQEMEQELKETKENLQAVIEEIEAANEELQSTNEEMVSTNEELQSTNEELQSLNEELHTVSSEHQSKIKELMELNEDMNNYFRNSDIGQILIDRNLIIRKFSPAVTQMVSLIETDINRSILDINTRFDSFDFIGDVKRVIKEGNAIEKEIVMGSDIYLMRINPYVKLDKTLDGVVINFIDITEAKKLNSILAAVLDSSPSCISAMKAVRNKKEEIIDFEFLVTNKTLERSLGVKAGELRNKSFKKIYPDSWDEYFDIYKDVVEKESSKHYEFYDHRLGKWHDIVLVKLMDGLVSMVTDITDKKKAADMITQGYEDLKATSRKLRMTNMQLEQSNMDLMQFASVASHDLKEPLRKIQTFGNILMTKAKDKLEPAELTHLGKIITSSERMQKLIEDVLTLSKLSNRDLEFEKVNLNEVLGLIKDDLEITVREKNAEIIIEPLPTVKGISGQMHQIFQNLLSNALKFTNGKKPQIKISTKPIKKELIEELKLKNKNYQCISVKDNGIGFEETYKDKIFGIFQRLNGSNYDGTGIGLAICKKIIENHNGYITARSKLGKGAEFLIVLPGDN